MQRSVITYAIVVVFILLLLFLNYTANLHLIIESSNFSLTFFRYQSLISSSILSPMSYILHSGILIYEYISVFFVNFIPAFIVFNEAG